MYRFPGCLGPLGLFSRRKVPVSCMRRFQEALQKLLQLEGSETPPQNKSQKFLHKFPQEVSPKKIFPKKFPKKFLRALCLFFSPVFLPRLRLEGRSLLRPVGRIQEASAAHGGRTRHRSDPWPGRLLGSGGVGQV